MSGPFKEGADQVMEAIRGGTMAQKAVHDIRGGHAAPDALFRAILACDGDRLRGFARELQKTLERAAPPA